MTVTFLKLLNPVQKHLMLFIPRSAALASSCRAAARAVGGGRIAVDLAAIAIVVFYGAAAGTRR